MKKDWNLKGKEKYVIDWDLLNEHEIKIEMKNIKSMDISAEAIKVFQAKDIETLKKKLIEDIQEIMGLAVTTSIIDYGELLNDIIKAINKRFGVDKKWKTNMI